MTHYNLSLNIENFTSILGDIFTSDFTFVTELAQNAQRAGSEYVSFDLDENQRILTITDNGCGFDEDGWASFFDIASSGWNKDIKSDQKPFGVGAMAMMYAADEIYIESNEYHCHFFTDDLLSGESVTPIKHKNLLINGTQISLRLKPDYKLSNLQNSQFNEKFKGFTIPVVLNEEHIERTVALDSYKSGYTETKSGNFTFLHASRPADAKSIFDVYLQGYCVAKNGVRHNRLSADVIVHLHGSDYRSRVPDRDVLLDADAVNAEINKAWDEIITEDLINRHDEMDVREFSAKYFKLAVTHLPVIVKTLPFPTDYFSTAELPAADYLDFEDYVGGHDFKEVKAIYPEDLEGEKIMVLDFYDDLTESEHVWSAWSYLYLSDRFFLNGTYHVPKDHWINDHLLYLDDYEITHSIKAHNARHRSERNDITGWDTVFNFILTEGYDFSISVGDDTFTVENCSEAIYTWGNKFLVTKNQTHIADYVVRSCGSFRTGYDGQERDESYLDAYHTAANHAFDLARMEDPVASLLYMLNGKEEKLQQILSGDTANISFMSNGSINVKVKPATKHGMRKGSLRRSRASWRASAA